jgi:hypothetical protein
MELKALTDAVKHIQLSADSAEDRKWGEDADAQLQALREAVEAARKLEIEVKPTPNGNKVLVIWDGSVFEELATALAKLEAKGE